VAEVWRSIKAVVARAELGAAVATVQELIPSANADDEGETPARLAEPIGLVSGFVRPLCAVIEFAANPAGAAVLRKIGEWRSCSRPAS
jgi:hypothetical protein